MSISFKRLLTLLTAVCFMLGFASKLAAAPAPPGPLLIQAYVTLAHSNHDYKGHRVAAMKHIEAAAKVLGVDVRGDGKVREPQVVSDNQLHVAKSMLEQAHAELSGAARKHVEKALRQLSVALNVK